MQVQYERDPLVLEHPYALPLRYIFILFVNEVGTSRRPNAVFKWSACLLRNCMVNGVDNSCKSGPGADTGGGVRGTTSRSWSSTILSCMV